MVDDEFGPYLTGARREPRFESAYADAGTLHRVLDALVKRRCDLGITQGDLAERLGVRQPTISEFENESSDPRLSTLQRYARAVGAELHVEVRDAAG